MIQFLKPYKIEELQNALPKKLSHIKEDAKVKFIKEVMFLYRLSDDFGYIDFEQSTYNGIEVKIVYTPLPIKIELKRLIHDVMEKWFFSNLEKNENVYFYRFINLFRSELTQEEWKDVDFHLRTTNELVLGENYKQYTDYRKKLDEIDILLQDENFSAKENY
jgi:hypothetical protein|tara:strand:+ start:2410 stop:2895 length:486 start_codon:yes stop_codon:yes gene_type:complete